MGKPGELLELAVDSLRAATKRPMVGKSYTPARFRVASRELAEVLQAGLGDIEVVCAATPDMDEVLGERKYLSKGDDEAEYYFSLGASVGEIGAFFDATAELFRARPWNVVPADTGLISVTIHALGVRESAISIIGQAVSTWDLPCSRAWKI